MRNKLNKKECERIKKIVDDKIEYYDKLNKPFPVGISPMLSEMCNKLLKNKYISLTDYIEYTHKINDMTV